MSTMTGNPTYNLTSMSKEEILQNQHSVMLTFGISLPEEDIDFPNCTGFLNFTRIRTSRDILRVQLSAHQASFSDSNTNPNRS